MLQLSILERDFSFLKRKIYLIKKFQDFYATDFLDQYKKNLLNMNK